MDEFEIIRRYFVRASSDSDIRIPIGDDGAVLQPSPDHDLVSVVDTLVSGVHFPESLEPADVGYRSVVVNLSDVAAMGARPRWMTLALTLREASHAWLERFAQGLFEAADEYAVTLVGGDTTRGSETVISVQILGDVRPGSALTRSGAAPGDGIFVTGCVGDAAAGLSILQSGAADSEDVDYLVRRFARPSARVAVGAAIAEFAHAAIDVSDGLYGDLEKMLLASGVAGSLELSKLPLSPQLTRLVKRDDALQFALSGGEDYELCFTADPDAAAIEELAEHLGVAISRIGGVNEGNGITCLSDGRPFDYSHPGYRHFH
ncbi:MAG: thiamine-phosphate kinase [Woeseiaceae bacterium]|nr:thiamine-phosphate kinase [Woeseiaceae bacterium]